MARNRKKSKSHCYANGIARRLVELLKNNTPYLRMKYYSRLLCSERTLYEQLLFSKSDFINPYGNAERRI